MPQTSKEMTLVTLICSPQNFLITKPPPFSLTNHFVSLKLPLMSNVCTLPVNGNGCRNQSTFYMVLFSRNDSDIAHPIFLLFIWSVPDVAFEKCQGPAWHTFCVRINSAFIASVQLSGTTQLQIR